MPTDIGTHSDVVLKMVNLLNGYPVSEAFTILQLVRAEVDRLAVVSIPLISGASYKAGIVDMNKNG